MNLKKLEEISSIACQESAIALSKMVQVPVSVGVHTVESKNSNEIFRMIEAESLLAVVSYELVGETQGSLALILPKETVFLLSDLLLKKERGSTKEFSEETKGAIEELGNIILGNYLRAFSRQLDLSDLLHRAGNLIWGTAESVEEQILSSMDLLKEKGTLLTILFSFQEAVVKGYVLVVLTLGSLKMGGGGDVLT